MCICAGRQEHTAMDCRASGIMGQLNPTCLLCAQQDALIKYQSTRPHRQRSWIGTAVQKNAGTAKQAQLNLQQLQTQQYNLIFDNLLVSSVNGHPMWPHGDSGQRG